MHLNKRFLMLALAAMAAAAFVVPASASAAGNGSCVFSGLAGNIAPGVMLMGGSGEYDFGGTGQCVLSGVPAPNSSIRSTGDFNNIVCGTGEAFSRDNHSGPGHPVLNPVDSSDDRTTIDDPASAGVEIQNASYHISFKATQGELDIHTIDDETPAGDEAESLPHNGHIAIVPAAGSCNSPTGVTAFTVSGNIVAAWG